MNSLRKLINLVEQSGESVYVSNDRAKSVSLDRLPTNVADMLRNDPNTKGKFEFVDDGDEWFSHVNSYPMPFIEAAKQATEAYAKSRDTRFARLIVARYRIDAW